jgi:hypothetical protein
MKKLAAIRIDVASCAHGEGVLTHPSPDSRDRIGNLVSRQHTDCLNMVNKVAALPMRPESTGRKARNMDEVLKIVRLLTTKNPYPAQFFAARRAAFQHMTTRGVVNAAKDFASHSVARQVTSDLCLTFGRPSLSNKAT